MLAEVIALTAPHRGFVVRCHRYPNTNRKLPAPRLLVDMRGPTPQPFATREEAMTAMNAWRMGLVKPTRLASLLKSVDELPGDPAPVQQAGNAPAAPARPTLSLRPAPHVAPNEAMDYEHETHVRKAKPTAKKRDTGHAKTLVSYAAKPKERPAGRDTLQPILKRDRNVEHPQLVIVTGHAGKPWTGIQASHPDARTGTVRVIIARPLGSTPPESVVAHVRHVRPLQPLDTPDALLDKLVACKAMTKGEADRVRSARNQILRSATRKGSIKRIEIYDTASDRQRHNIGAGAMVRDHMRLVGFGR